MWLLIGESLQDRFVENPSVVLGLVIVVLGLVSAGVYLFKWTEKKFDALNERVIQEMKNSNTAMNNNNIAMNNVSNSLNQLISTFKDLNQTLTNYLINHDK